MEANIFLKIQKSETLGYVIITYIYTSWLILYI